jgi:hypothetical protein
VKDVHFDLAEPAAPGAGVPGGELRQRLADAFNESLYHGEGWNALPDIALAEIAAAGFKMVPADAIVLAPCEPEVLMPGFDPDEYDLEGWE